MLLSEMINLSKVATLKLNESAYKNLFSNRCITFLFVHKIKIFSRVYCILNKYVI